ncbi:hypothetical protein B0T17DRAFT_534698 [Bombardia bombarda]|uniref:Tetratricopeptide repeat protein 1 n=1 Tax=Bombardia bombarda TaxID=252184 RepID=A0AA39WU80_9PEZI|nr:hypothetical protein B0T17DRAFT_534698 [Bombardia bombarda]
MMASKGDSNTKGRGDKISSRDGGPSQEAESHDNSHGAETLTPQLTPEEEAALVAESNKHKAEASTLFTSGNYDAAINKYDMALGLLPATLDYELAVLRSNISVCHLNLEEWKEAITTATAALDNLDKAEQASEEKYLADKADEEDVEEEIISPGAALAGPPLPESDKDYALAHRKRQENIARIRAKALIRRARARSELGGWQNLEGAIADYKAIAAMSNLPASDMAFAWAQLKKLPARAKAAQEEETAEMWGKLKQLGNGILKPFGLSTDNFKMVQDEKTGGYSMNFEGGAGGSKS